MEIDLNRGLPVESRPERLTGDAGAVLLREILERSGIVPCLVGRLADLRRADLVTYPLDALLVLFGVIGLDGLWRFLLSHRLAQERHGRCPDRRLSSRIVLTERGGAGAPGSIGGRPWSTLPGLTSA